MLRIKDGIDLKELEKFGFQKAASSNGGGPFIGHGWVIYETSKWNKNRNIIEWERDPNLDIIFDLINAGMVEKVEEEDDDDEEEDLEDE